MRKTLKRYTITTRNASGKARTRSFRTREARDEALLGAYLLLHRDKSYLSAELRDPSGYQATGGRHE